MTNQVKSDRSPTEHFLNPVVSSRLDNPGVSITNDRNHESSSSIDYIRKMTCSSPMRQKQANLTVLDVYDEAALIGKDFERIIEAYGTDTIRDLVPKVIRILELLELQATKNEKEAEEYLEMKTRIERLETEKNETRELREKFDRELDVVEEQWRKEADNLMALVSKLQDENRRLRDEIERHKDLHNKSDFAIPADTINITREELLCIKNLTEENLKLKRLMKSKDKEITQKNLDMEAVQAQLERVCKLNCTLRQKNTFSTNQTQRLMVEKLDLEVQLKEKENIINQMKDRVGDDLASPVSPENPINELANLKTNAPRFTLGELRQVLLERNELKTKLMEVEEELRLFKDEDEDDDSNAPVEGPIPLEPEEKLYGYKRNESKIRQLFFSVDWKSVTKTLRSIFPTSKKTSPSETNSPMEASIKIAFNRSSTAVSFASTQSTSTTTKQLSATNTFDHNQTPSNTNIPLLSPPPSM